jgi:hypothetical protein
VVFDRFALGFELIELFRQRLDLLLERRFFLLEGLYLQAS